MRITGGARRGIRLATFRHRQIRPTTDRVREAIFNVLGQSLEGMVVLDLFAGTGAMAIEALSRGAERATLVDNSFGAVAIIKKNLGLCGYDHRAEVWRRDVLSAIRELARRGCCFDIIFIDAPYGEPGLLESCLEQLAQSCLVGEDTVLVCECSKRSKPAIPHGLRLIKGRQYGDTMVYFIEREHGR